MVTFRPQCISDLIWLKIYLTALVRTIWERDISIEIILNNTGLIPIDCSITEAAYEEELELEYVNIAVEIVKRAQNYYQSVQDISLRTKNLYYCGLAISGPCYCGTRIFNN